MADERTIKKALDLITLRGARSIASIESVTTKRRIAVAKRRVGVASPKEKHVAQLRGVLASRNVVGVGIAQKHVAGKSNGKLALTFYVERKQPLKRLKATEAVPPAIAEALSGPRLIPTDVVALGRLRLEANVTRSPIQPGNSVGHVKVSAGTLGAIVSSAKSHIGKP